MTTTMLFVCRSAWDYNFYLDAIDLMNKNNSIDIVYGPKNHKKSIIKNTYRKIISYSSYIFLQILFPLSFKHETQCIKVFKSKLRFFKFLHDYNYFAEAEFFFYQNYLNIIMNSCLRKLI